MSDREFGGTIRQRRERLGLSVTRVAELVGRGPGTVRAWERGTSHPSDPAVVSSLAAVLGIDEAEAFRLAGLEPPVPRGQVTVEQALRSLAEEERPAPAAARPSEMLGGEITDRPPADTRAVPPPPATPPPAAASVDEPGESAQDPDQSRRGAHVRSEPTAERPGFLDRLREATARKPKAVSAAPLTTLPQGTVEPSYVEDPDERWSYRMRSALTAIGIAFLFLVFAWAAINLLEAVGETWDILTSNL